MALKDNLTSYWSLQGNSNDSAGTQNGTDTSISYSTSYGKIDQGASFNGSTSLISKTSTNLPSGSSARTVSLWIYRTGTEGTVFFYGTAVAGGMIAINLNATGLNCFGNTGTYDITTTTTISSSTWYHIVFTNDGTTSRLYKNASETGNKAITYSTTASSELQMGNGTPWASTPWTGYIDEVGVWTRALSGSEITELYNSGSGKSYADIIGSNSNFFALM